MDDPRDFADREEYRPLKDYCSRLAGDRLCRCGANLNSRYCLWTYLRPAAPDRPPAAGKSSPAGK